MCVCVCVCVCVLCVCVVCVKGMVGAAVLRALRTPLPWSLAAASCRCSAPVETLLPPAPRVLSPPWSSCSVRPLQLCSALCAGHNKWSKVKHIKGPKDEARGRMFMKFGMMIKIAVKGEAAEWHVSRVYSPAPDPQLICHLLWFHPQKGDRTRSWM